MIKQPEFSATPPLARKEFNWKLIAKKAQTERDLAFLRKREQELSQPVAQIYGSLDSGRQQKLKKVQKIISTKEGYLDILSDAIRNH